MTLSAPPFFPRLLTIALILAPAALSGEQVRAAPATPSKPAPAWQAGAYFLARGNYPEALSRLSGAISKEKSPASELNLLGVAQMMNGQFASSIATFDSALKLDPGLEEARLNRGVALLKVTSFEAAARVFSELHQTSSGTMKGRAAYHAALAESGRGNLSSARAWLEKTLQIEPAHDDALLYLGVIQERLGSLQESGRSYKKYLDRNPQSPVALLRFGVVAQRAGNVETSIECFRRVVQLAPESLEAVEARKYLLMWE